MSDERTGMSVVRELRELFELEERGPDLFVGRNGHRRGAGDSVFGGQLVAQALRAAAATVPGDQRPHSLHGYFVRPARRAEPVRYAVERLRDGARSSLRQIRAMQDDRTVFVELASFRVAEPGATVDAVTVGDALGPEHCDPIEWDALLETRAVRIFSPTPRVHLCDAMWVRVPSPFPADPTMRACALAYLTDIGNGFATIDQPGLPGGGPSLDHAVWFHELISLDQWLLVDHRPQRASDSRGTFLGTIRGIDGTLGAVLTQELLLRMPSPFARPPRPASPSG